MRQPCGTKTPNLIAMSHLPFLSVQEPGSSWFFMMTGRGASSAGVDASFVDRELGQRGSGVGENVNGDQRPLVVDIRLPLISSKSTS